VIVTDAQHSLAELVEDGVESDHGHG
jgi:hypothetical protein